MTHLPAAEGITLPFKAVALITEHGRTRLDVTVKVGAPHPWLFCRTPGCSTYRRPCVCGASGAGALQCARCRGTASSTLELSAACLPAP